jgi:hypothetical protein
VCILWSYKTEDLFEHQQHLYIYIHTQTHTHTHMFYGWINFVPWHQQPPPKPSPQESGTFECTTEEKPWYKTCCCLQTNKRKSRRIKSDINAVRDLVQSQYKEHAKDKTIYKTLRTNLFKIIWACKEKNTLARTSQNYGHTDRNITRIWHILISIREE